MSADADRPPSRVELDQDIDRARIALDEADAAFRGALLNFRHHASLYRGAVVRYLRAVERYRTERVQAL